MSKADVSIFTYIQAAISILSVSHHLGSFSRGSQVADYDKMGKARVEFDSIRYDLARIWYLRSTMFELIKFAARFRI